MCVAPHGRDRGRGADYPSLFANQIRWTSSKQRPSRRCAPPAGRASDHGRARRSLAGRTILRSKVCGPPTEHPEELRAGTSSTGCAPPADEPPSSASPSSWRTKTSSGGSGTTRCGCPCFSSSPATCHSGPHRAGFARSWAMSSTAGPSLPGLSSRTSGLPGIVLSTCSSRTCEPSCRPHAPITSSAQNDLSLWFGGAQLVRWLGPWRPGPAARVHIAATVRDTHLTCPRVRLGPRKRALRIDPAQLVGRQPPHARALVEDPPVEELCFHALSTPSVGRAGALQATPSA